MKGLRAQILEKLVRINGVQRWAVSDWRDATRVLDRTANPYGYRKARPDELPENNIEALRQLERRMRIVGNAADEILLMAVNRRVELERGK